VNYQFLTVINTQRADVLDGRLEFPSEKINVTPFQIDDSLDSLIVDVVDFRRSCRRCGCGAGGGRGWSRRRRAGGRCPENRVGHAHEQRSDPRVPVVLFARSQRVVLLSRRDANVILGIFRRDVIPRIDAGIESDFDTVGILHGVVLAFRHVERIAFQSEVFSLPCVFRQAPETSVLNVEITFASVR